MRRRASGYDRSMCGRIVQVPFYRGQSPWPELSDALSSTTPNFNLAPTQRLSVVAQAEGALAVRPLRWGLLPFWVKDLKGGMSTINARIETVATKPAFRSAFKTPTRCLVPMAGYYEWKQLADGKQPFFIHRTDHLPLFAAGLWEPRHRLQEETDMGSCTVITQDAVDVAGEVHDRMPVFLDPLAIDDWASTAVEDAMAMLLAARLPALTAHPVTRAVNNARNRGGPEFLEPIALGLPVS